MAIYAGPSLRTRLTSRRAAGLAVLAICLIAAREWLRDRKAKNAAARAVHVTLVPIPGLATGARLEIVAPNATDVEVRYGRDIHYGAAMPRTAVPLSGRLVTTMIGLEPAATTHARVVVHLASGDTVDSGDLTVKTPPLEPDIPRTIPIVVNRTASKDFVLLSLNQKDVEGGLGVILDRSGRLLWYRRAHKGAYAVERLPNGHILQHQLDTLLFEEVELDGTVVRTWHDEKSINGTDGHDIHPLPNGNALVFGAETHQVDTRQLFPKGIEHAVRWDDTVSEVTAHGDVIWRWSSYGHISEDEMLNDPLDPIDPRDYEVVHTNTIETTPDGSVLLSFRNISSIVKIDRGTGAIVWRLGGKRSDFRFLDDPLGGFYKQHDARFISADHILLFDNGNFHTPPESRAAEYRLDMGAKTATLVWQYRKTPLLFAHITGSVQRLPDGHTLISWGPKSTVTEVTNGGETVWELKAPGFGIYRARWLKTLYP